MRIVALVMAGLLAGCTGAASPPTGSMPASPGTAAAASPGTGASGAVPAGPTATPATSTASPGAPTARPLPSVTAIAGQLVARIVSYPDVYASPVPAELSVYSDGLLVSAGWRSGAPDTVQYTVRTLTSAGLAAVRSAFDKAVAKPGEMGSITQVGAGYTTYVATTRRGSHLETAWTTNASGGAAARALTAFAERWMQPETQLPASAWAASSAVPFSSGRWAMVIEVSNDATPEPSLRADTALTALVGPLGAFGEPAPGQPSSTRCGALDATGWLSLAGALASGGVDIGDGYGRTTVTMAHGATGQTALTLIPLLPDTLDACHYVYEDALAGP